MGGRWARLVVLVIYHGTDGMAVSTRKKVCVKNWKPPNKWSKLKTLNFHLHPYTCLPCFVWDHKSAATCCAQKLRSLGAWSLSIGFPTHGLVDWLAPNLSFPSSNKNPKVKKPRKFCCPEICVCRPLVHTLIFLGPT